MDEIFGTNHALFDINGDGKPDLIDTEDNVSNITWINGAQRYWKVYINTGSSFSSTAQNWNVPNVEVSSEAMDEINGVNHALFDINGDGTPDLIGTEDNVSNITWINGAQRYWKVYANVTPVVNIQELDNSVALNIYPNPTENNLHVDLSQLPISSIQIYNNIGLLIYQEQNITSSEAIIDLSPMPVGVYYVTVWSNDKAFNTKVIKK